MKLRPTARTRREGSSGSSTSSTCSLSGPPVSRRRIAFTRGWSSAGPARLALLDERGDALRPVLGAETAEEALGLSLQAFIERDVGGGGGQLLHDAHRVRRALGERAGDLERTVEL